MGATDFTERDPLVATFSTPAFEQPGQFVATCRGLDLSTAPTGLSKKTQWVRGVHGETLLHFALRPNERSCTNHGSLESSAFTAGSRHPGGVNVLFADGHARFVRGSVDEDTWRASSTIASGEVVSDPDF